MGSIERTPGRRDHSDRIAFLVVIGVALAIGVFLARRDEPPRPIQPLAPQRIESSLAPSATSSENSIAISFPAAESEPAAEPPSETGAALLPPVARDESEDEELPEDEPSEWQQLEEQRKEELDREKSRLETTSVLPTEGEYHTVSCQAVPRDRWGDAFSSPITLGEAGKQSLRACRICNPPAYR